MQYGTDAWSSIVANNGSSGNAFSTELHSIKQWFISSPFFPWASWRTLNGFLHYCFLRFHSVDAGKFEVVLQKETIFRKQSSVISLYRILQIWWFHGKFWLLKNHNSSHITKYEKPLMSLKLLGRINLALVLQLPVVSARNFKMLLYIQNSLYTWLSFSWYHQHVFWSTR